eukprot:NODE_5347_length_1026_cov_59.168328_g4778_i0.p1 GENE.NODE_5347_length_1026_cov_59.168328_g4778_i0~~NODE_5347_length_1026_cov_59.168328_g4778_i0.p1  ORF type:complete len:293 (-),score=72.84 NODE_5347_length_1026_cov_59.168328_g4778_i0:102-980(-)
MNLTMILAVFIVSLIFGVLGNPNCYPGQSGPGFTSAPVIGTTPVKTKVSYHMYEVGTTLPVACQAYVGKVQNSKYITAFAATQAYQCGYGCGTCIKLTNEWTKKSSYFTIVDLGGNFFDVDHSAFSELFGQEGINRGCGEAIVEVVNPSFCSGADHQLNAMNSKGNCRCPDVDSTFKSPAGSTHYWECPNPKFTGKISGGSDTPKPSPVQPTPKPASPTPKPASPTPKPASPTPKPASPTPKPTQPISPTPKPGGCKCKGTSLAQAQNPAVNWEAWCQSNGCNPPSFCAMSC